MLPSEPQQTSASPSNNVPQTCALAQNLLNIGDIDNIMVFLNRAAKTGAEADVMERVKEKLAEMHATMCRNAEEIRRAAESPPPAPPKK